MTQQFTVTTTDALQLILVSQDGFKKVWSGDWFGWWPAWTSVVYGLSVLLFPDSKLESWRFLRCSGGLCLYCWHRQSLPQKHCIEVPDCQIMLLVAWAEITSFQFVIRASIM